MNCLIEDAGCPQGQYDVQVTGDGKIRLVEKPKPPEGAADAVAAEYLNGQVLADGLNAIVRALSTHQGDVNAGGFDINNVGTLRCQELEWVGVLPVFANRQIQTGAGLTGGGDLSADRTLSVVADTVTQRIEVLKAGSLIATRHAVNLIEGANVNLTVADDAENNRVNVTVAGWAPATTRPSRPTARRRRNAESSTSVRSSRSPTTAATTAPASPSLLSRSARSSPPAPTINSSTVPPTRSPPGP